MYWNYNAGYVASNTAGVKQYGTKSCCVLCLSMSVLQYCNTWLILVKKYLIWEYHMVIIVDK